MNKKIKDLDLSQRPREKLKNEGYASGFDNKRCQSNRCVSK